MTTQIPPGRYFIQFTSSNPSNPIHLFIADDLVASGLEIPEGGINIFNISQGSSGKMALSVTTAQGNLLKVVPIQQEPGSDIWLLGNLEEGSNLFSIEQMEDQTYRLGQKLEGSDNFHFMTLMGSEEEANVHLEIETGTNQELQKFTYKDVQTVGDGDFFIMTEDETGMLYSIPGSNEIEIGGIGDLPEGAWKVFCLKKLVGDGEKYQIQMTPSSGERKSISLREEGSNLWKLELADETTNAFTFKEVEVEGDFDTPVYEVGSKPGGSEEVYLTNDPESPGNTPTMQAKSADKKQKWKFIRSRSLSIIGLDY